MMRTWRLVTDTTITPTADEIVSASLTNGALLAVCDIEMAMPRARDEEHVSRTLLSEAVGVTLVQIGHTAVASFLLSTTGFLLDPCLLS